VISGAAMAAARTMVMITIPDISAGWVYQCRTRRASPRSARAPGAAAGEGAAPGVSGMALTG
jgi:hypothetical protein